MATIRYDEGYSFLTVRMASAFDVLQLCFIVVCNTAATALLVRLFRNRLSSSWGPVVFAIVLIPPVLVVLTQLFGLLGFGFDLGSPRIVFALLVFVPFAVGLTIDYFWMPAPEDVELPDEYRRN